MAIAVGQVVEQARDVHPAFAERNSPEPICIAFLNRYVQGLVARVRRVNTDLLVQQHAVPLPLADFEAGYAGLPAFQEIRRDAVLRYGDVERIATQTVAALRLMPPQWPAFYMEGSSLFLAGREADWTGATSLVVRLIPAMVKMSAPTENVPLLPDEAEGALVDQLAAWMARRTADAAGAPPIDRAFLAAQAAESEALFMEQVMRRQGTASVHVPQEDWP
jgi:hypothetical protein